MADYPNIPSLPIAPSRNDPPDIFNTRVNDFLAAMVPFADNVNRSGAWITDQLVYIDGRITEADQLLQQTNEAKNTTLNYRNIANQAAQNAKDSETAAKTSETNSKTSETAANSSKVAAASSATAASDSKTAAANSATAAAGSATAANTSKEAASASAASAGNAAELASTKASGASDSATAAAGSAETATGAADTATGAASTATTKADEASDSATRAETARDNAEELYGDLEAINNAVQTSEVNASTSTTAAENAEQSEQNAAQSAQTSLDNAKLQLSEMGLYGALYALPKLPFTDLKTNPKDLLYRKYWFAGNQVSNLPPGIGTGYSSFGVYEVFEMTSSSDKPAPENFMQYLIRITFNGASVPPLTYEIRMFASSGAFSDWSMAYNKSRIVGTVNDTISSAIIESGSNANGYYIKYADGSVFARRRLTISDPSQYPKGFYLLSEQTLPVAFYNAFDTGSANAIAVVRTADPIKSLNFIANTKLNNLNWGYFSLESRGIVESQFTLEIELQAWGRWKA